MRADRHASLVRATVIAIWLILLVATPFHAYASFPIDWAEGHGIGRLLLATTLGREVLLHPVALWLLKWSGIAMAALLLLWPRQWRGLLPLLFLVVLCLDALTKAFDGYTNHAQLAPLFTLGLFALYWRVTWHGPWERPSGGSRPSEVYDTVLWLAAVLIVLPYTYIGVHRWLTGGVAVFMSDALLDYIRVNSLRNSNFAFTWFVPWVELPWIALVLKAGFVLTTVFETLAVGVLLSRRFRLVWIAVMTAFHLLTLVAMNIFFWENLLLIFAVLGPRCRPGGLKPPGSDGRAMFFGARRLQPPG